ncbi:hypothetical protein HW555_000510 [Spodoptera exigua]|uniref:FLYWCH-type domain-containing protein n=1 Tax=Spodoptera exigua TaxID=7107 RepID=A0A835GT77_SPOEX|nr:hypothetical protein HW555_000510 [Spodoptera exigua]
MFDRYQVHYFCLSFLITMADIPSTSSGLIHFDFVTSKRGGRVLLLEGHQYYQKKEYKNGSSYWRCVNWPKCHGTTTIMLTENKIMKSTVHKCQKSIAKNEVRKAISICKTKVSEDFKKTIPTVYREAVISLKDASDDTIKEFPSYKNVKSNLYKKRNMAVGVKKTRYAIATDVEVPDIFQKFLLFDYNIPNWDPMKFTVDFEAAVMSTLEEKFPEASIKGCFYHFNRAIWKKAEQLNLSKNKITRKHVALLTVLAHLPPEAVTDGYLYIMEDSPTDEAVTKFNDYFVKQWFENNLMKDKWCCYGERHRTTNKLEGWHAMLNRTLVAAQEPNKFLLTPSSAVTPRIRSVLVSSTVVVCRPGALILNVDISSTESEQRNTAHFTDSIRAVFT